MAKATIWTVTDAEARKRGEQTGLDTLVVHSRLGSTAARLKLKGIDGGPHKQRSMWFNSKQREKPYQDLTSYDRHGNMASLRSMQTGGAWLSSARVVRCSVKSDNERNPYY